MSVCSLAMLSTDGSPYLNNSKAITMELPLNRDELRQRWEAGVNLIAPDCLLTKRANVVDLT